MKSSLTVVASFRGQPLNSTTMPTVLVGRRRSKILGVALVVVAVIVPALYGLTLPLRSDVMFGRRSIAYLELVAPRTVIRTFPVHRATSDVQYEYDAADGPAPARITVMFGTAAEADALLAAYSRYCAERGLQPAPAKNGLTCHAKGYQIAIQPSVGAQRNQVVLVFEEEES